MSYRLTKRIGPILYLLSGLWPCAAQSDRETKPFIGTSQNLIGSWAGNGEVIDLRADGQCLYNGKIMTYVVSADHISFQSESSVARFSFAVKAGKLILTAGGEQAVYSRLASVPSSPSSLPTRSVPGELLGRWCYLKSSDGAHTDRCITLRAGGTYLFEGELAAVDSGTWYVEENRLYYQSQRRGRGYYVLERRNHQGESTNPMIVLDNEPFITTERRAPWK